MSEIEEEAVECNRINLILSFAEDLLPYRLAPSINMFHLKHGIARTGG